MRLGVVIDGSDQFIREILLDWRSRYETEVFSYHDLKYQFLQGRINNYRRRYALHQFLHKNDIVFFEWAGPLLISASRLPPSAKIITRLHSWELYAFSPYINWQAVNRVVLVGQAMKRRFCELYPVEAAKTVVVSNGVRMDIFRPTYLSHGGVIGMLGDLFPIKRVYEVILAVYELHNRGYDFTLRLGGPPPVRGPDEMRYYAALNHLVNKLGMNNYVHFEGRIERAELFMSQLDIFISNSYWESQHVALVEAMASGCFCLGHGWDGIEDILPNDNIFFTNTELLEKVINYWNQSEELRLRHRTQLHSIASEKFDIEKVKVRIRGIIEEVEGNIR